MLKIEIDRAYPHHSLFACAELLSLIGQAIDSPQIDMPEEARNGAGWTIGAVRDALGEITEAINDFMRDERGLVQPMRRAPGSAAEAAPPAAPPAPPTSALERLRQAIREQAGIDLTEEEADTELRLAGARGAPAAPPAAPAGPPRLTRRRQRPAASQAA